LFIIGIIIITIWGRDRVRAPNAVTGYKENALSGLDALFKRLHYRQVEEQVPISEGEGKGNWLRD